MAKSASVKYKDKIGIWKRERKRFAKTKHQNDKIFQT